MNDNNAPLRLFLDPEAGRAYLEALHWPNGPECPQCRSGGRVSARPEGYYKCYPCKLVFTVRTGTVMERSHVPLNKWLHAMYLLMATPRGISSSQLGLDIRITQKSAWYVLRRLQEADSTDLAAQDGANGKTGPTAGGSWAIKPAAQSDYPEQGKAADQPVVTPEGFAKFVEGILAHRPRPKSKPAKKRERERRQKAE